ncbi:acyl-CoA thioesterase [Paludifilum halophilum]|uniref:4-hydroxybenzoyl-CoA thioesterase n=1 Tax=Paludifilum halophilum TaxID=1642702 RepID=A0A235BAY3_9BACL|nr:acyl-CoA thioesterase [Paludifilum halophilum]OYD09453.1 4-hydroxybenzoyl-CoA thioesterase [Paludifilum halophilum]
MKHEFELTVRSTDVDMIGHVNHAQYLVYMEWARVEWMRGLGLTLGELKRRQILPVIVNVKVDYLKELLYDEKAKVISEPLRKGNKSSVIRQRIQNGSGDVVCEAEITWVMMDAVHRKATSLPREMEDWFQAVTC